MAINKQNSDISDAVADDGEPRRASTSPMPTSLSGPKCSYRYRRGLNGKFSRHAQIAACPAPSGPVRSRSVPVRGGGRGGRAGVRHERVAVHEEGFGVGKMSPRLIQDGEAMGVDAAQWCRTAASEFRIEEM